MHQKIAGIPMIWWMEISDKTITGTWLIQIIAIYNNKREALSMLRMWEDIKMKIWTGTTCREITQDSTILNRREALSLHRMWEEIKMYTVFETTWTTTYKVGIQINNASIWRIVSTFPIVAFRITRYADIKIDAQKVKTADLFIYQMQLF